MTEAATALWAIVILFAGLLMLASRHAHAVPPQLRGIEERLDLVRDAIRVGRARADDKVGGDVGSMSGSGSAPCPEARRRRHETIGGVLVARGRAACE